MRAGACGVRDSEPPRGEAAARTAPHGAAKQTTALKQTSPKDDIRFPGREADISVFGERLFAGIYKVVPVRCCHHELRGRYSDLVLNCG